MAPRVRPSTVCGQNWSNRALTLNVIGRPPRSRRRAPPRAPLLERLGRTDDLQVVGGAEKGDISALDLEQEDALRLDVAVLGEGDLLGDGVVDRGEPLDVLEERLPVGVALLDAG